MEAAQASATDRERLERCRAALARMIDEGRLAEGDASTGVELEVALVDDGMQPAMRNQAVLDHAGSDSLTTELGSWNLEINLPPRPLPDAAEGALERDITGALTDAATSARGEGARAVTIGILPTLRPAHLAPAGITDETRYALLDEGIRRARGRPLAIDIATPTGAGERVRMEMDSVAGEAACTSLQLHLRLSPEAFPGYWNAAQAIAGVQTAVAANSPFFLGRRLWAETRVPLFTQAADTRTDGQRRRGAPPRVWFGHRWTSTARELFDENVHDFEVLLPLTDPDGEPDPLETLDRGEVPALTELRAHNSTVWRWNRPVYDVADGVAHLRLENRVLPAAPTAADAAADAMFFYGLVRTLAEQDRPLWQDLSFDAARANFTAAAQYGIEARQHWPGHDTLGVTDLVLDTLLPAAETGLASWGVDSTAAARHLSVIEGRCRTRRTGATWQTDVVAALERRGTSREDAMRTMLELYLAGAATAEPVHTWPT